MGLYIGGLLSDGVRAVGSLPPPQAQCPQPTEVAQNQPWGWGRWGWGGPSQVLVVQEFGVLPGLPEAVETEVKILLNHLFAYMGRGMKI